MMEGATFYNVSSLHGSERGRDLGLEERVFGLCGVGSNDVVGHSCNSVADSAGEFERVALEVFRFQAQRCEVYAAYLASLGVNPDAVQAVEDIPFMPISMFRSHNVYCTDSEPELVFSSSGTTGGDTSFHRVAFAEVYRRSFMVNFREFYGDPAEWAIFALLPNYLERQGSSLVVMANELQACNADCGGFFLYDFAEFERQLRVAVAAGQRVMVLGVTFALLDFADSHCVELGPGSVVMETGGMKGRRREVARDELHGALCAAFGVYAIHSEYGMTEMLAQAYSLGEGLFRPSRLMRVVGADLLSPLCGGVVGRPARLCVVDLANIYSCSFLQTGDRGVVYEDGSFRVDGRIEGELLRGCNMLQ